MSDLTLELGITCSSATARSAQPSANVAVQFYATTTASGDQEMVSKEEVVKSQNPTRSAQNFLRGILGSEVPEEKGKNVPTLGEIRRRTLEIHVRRGAHGCELDDYLDDWLQAQRELQEKYNKSNGEGATTK